MIAQQDPSHQKKQEPKALAQHQAPQKLSGKDLSIDIRPLISKRTFAWLLYEYISCSLSVSRPSAKGRPSLTRAINVNFTMTP